MALVSAHTQRDRGPADQGPRCSVDSFKCAEFAGPSRLGLAKLARRAIYDHRQRNRIEGWAWAALQ
jgi:hypothetical protein